MPSSVLPSPLPVVTAANRPAAAAGTAASNGVQQEPVRDHGPRSPLLAKLTGLTSIASVAAAGIVIVGVLALVGGNYAKSVVHDQLVPQKIYFPAKGSPELLPGVKQYAGQQLVNGSQAKAYANNFINVHLSKVAGGQTYAQVSAAAIAAPTNTKLAAEKATLFQGETLRSILLTAWGWSLVGTIVTLAGILHDRARRDPAAAAAGQLAGEPEGPARGCGPRLTFRWRRRLGGAAPPAPRATELGSQRPSCSQATVARSLSAVGLGYFSLDERCVKSR